MRSISTIGIVSFKLIFITVITKSSGTAFVNSDEIFLCRHNKFVEKKLLPARFLFLLKKIRKYVIIY